MKILLLGCEYSGTTTLAQNIFDWGQNTMGADFGLFHDHWKIPHVTGHWPIDTESFATHQEQTELLHLNPKMKEQMQRHNIYYHIQPGAFKKGEEEKQGFYSDYLAIGMHLEDAVYGPMYFGYGAEGQAAPRKVLTKTVERALLQYAPDFILVLVKASADTIRQRMENTPHPNQVIKPSDIEKVLKKFEDEFSNSQIHNKIILDTSKQNAKQTLNEFISKIEPFLSQD
ncbi:uncharacterized protein METZ01_LOCUS262884, partial [marine metagenome]